MKNNYTLTLVAGSRLRGVPQFGSEAERLHYERDVDSLLDELGDSVQTVHVNLGMIAVSLDEAEAAKWELDSRVYRVTRNMPAELLRSVSYDVSVQSNWALRQLSNRLNADTRWLCGFELTLTPVMYGNVPVVHAISLSSRYNKLLHKDELIDYEADAPLLLFTVGTVGFNFEVARYELGFDTAERALAMRLHGLSQPQSFIPLYTVDVTLYDEQQILQNNYADATLGFSNLVRLNAVAETYDCVSEGEGVDIIISDTQINYTLAEFGGRASIAYNPYADVYEDNYGSAMVFSTPIDTHGTSVASCAAGVICGVAKKANVLGVTTLDLTTDGRAREARELWALGWILDYVMDQKQQYPNKPIVINCSWKSDESSRAAQDDIIASIIAEGGIVCFGSGNDDSSAPYCPRAPDSIHVGSTDYAAVPADFTNFGPQLDVYAPGVQVPAITNAGELVLVDGTSYSTPYVSGLCALFASMYPGVTPAEVKATILAAAKPAVTYNKLDTTYLLAQNPWNGTVLRQEVHTPNLLENRVHVFRPFFVGFTGEKVYGEQVELTVNPITSVILSVGRKESAAKAVVIKLQP